MLKDIDIRNALKSSISKTNSPIYKICQKDQTTIVVDELCINDSTVRADMVAINGKLHCFEIKSDTDTFKRLDNQMHNYYQIFDEINFISTPKHIARLGDKLPQFVGVYEISYKNRNISFEMLQKPLQNTDRDIEKIFNLLWNIEAKQLAKLLKVKGYSKMKVLEVYNTVKDIVTEEKICYYVRYMLKLRAEKVNWKQGGRTKDLYDEYVRFLSTHQDCQLLNDLV